jgi:hypothetical protein
LERHQGEFKGEGKQIPFGVKLLLQSLAVLTLVLAFSLTLASACR